MINNNKGITLIALVVTIIIIMILASVGTYYGIENVENAKFQQAGVQIERMQLKVNELYEEYKSKGTITVNSEEISIENLGSGITDTTKRDKVLKTAKDRGTYVGDTTDYRYYDTSYIQNSLKMDGISYDFIINIKARLAIIYEGYEYDDKTYYTLNDFTEGDIYNVNYKGFNYTVEDGALNSTITISNIAYPGDFTTYNIKYGKVEDDIDNISWTEINDITYADNKTYEIKIYEVGTYAVRIEINGESIQYSHIEVNPKKDEANAPEVMEGMIPVIWDRGSLSWIKADINNENNSWYNYDTNENIWANAVTVSDNGTYSRDFYKNAEVGTKILMSDINTMFVWIPRYTYKTIYYTDDTYAEVSNEENTYYLNEITFSKGTEDLKSNKPILFNNDSNLKGFWVAKFEASSINDTISIKPNENSLKNIDFTSAKTKFEEMTAENNIYGLNAEEVETDILLDNSWDAISILSKIDSRVIRNNSYYEGTDGSGIAITRTGMAGENDDSETSADVSMEKQTENTGKITLKDSSTDTTYIYYEYWTDEGKKASTTGNVYGVYDMVGGSKEYTYYTEESGNIVTTIRGGDYSTYTDITSEAQEVDSSTSTENISFRGVIFSK